MIRKGLSLFLMLVAVSGPALAQTDAISGVSIGDKVRLRARHGEGKWWVGTVTALSPDSLWMQRDDSPNTHAFPLATTGELEVSRGRKSNFVPGLLYGALGGAVFFGSIGLLSGGDHDPNDAMINPTETALTGAAFGAGLGAILGGVFGALSHADRWEVVQLERVDAGVSVRYDGAVTLSLAYGF